MPRLRHFLSTHRRMRIALALALHCAGSPAAAAGHITLRAIGPYFDQNVVRFIAEKSELQQLPTKLLEAQGLTPRNVITTLCGHENAHYLALFLRMNSLAPEQLDAAGELVTRAAWPACLHVLPNTAKRRATVRPGESYSAIYQRLTGSPGQAHTVARFFAIPESALKTPLQPGKLLDYPHSTVEVTVRPRLSEEKFMAGLAAAAKEDGSSLHDVLNVLDPRDGEVLVDVPTDPDNDGAMRCEPFKDGPFSARAVVGAYRHSARNRDTGKARILVIDNGFFGATDEEEEDADIFAGSPFPPDFFARQGEGKQALAFKANITAYIKVDDQAFAISSVEPVNPHGDAPPDAVSGHGTHVTGLTLGGPYFRDSRKELRPDGAPWAQVFIMNVARGQRELLPNSSQEIFAALRLMDSEGVVVNMSFRFDADPNSTALFTEIARSASKTLFVVAAGNAGEPMPQGAVPAMLGGLGSDNQITVAASHQGGLASFSNRGPEYVDMAAPGCAIDSWLSNTVQPVALSGTSMAAGLVSFDASLISSLHPRLRPGLIKARILSSGDLLPMQRELVASQSSLNVAKSLFLFDDYVEYGGQKLLGRIESLPAQASQCAQGANVEAKGLWAYKQSPDGALLFHGKNQQRLKGICKGVAPAGSVSFRATHRIAPDGAVQPLGVEPPRDIPLASVQELLFRLP